MKFSIITITYNSKDYLEDTIASVLQQEFRNLEYIIIDGGSTDGTLDIIRSHADQDARIRWISEPDKGISDAMNKGILMAEGDFIAHLHSDDYYLPGTLRKVEQAFRQDSGIYWITGKARYVNESGETMYETTLKSSYSFNSIYQKNTICHPGTFFKKEVFRDIGLFDTELKYAMDYDIYLRTLRRYDLATIDETLVAFRVHANSLSSSNLISAIKEEQGISKKYRKPVPLHLTILRQLNYYKELATIRFGLNNLLKKAKYKFFGSAGSLFLVF